MAVGPPAEGMVVELQFATTREEEDHSIVVVHMEIMAINIIYVTFRKIYERLTILPI